MPFLPQVIALAIGALRAFQEAGLIVPDPDSNHFL